MYFQKVADLAVERNVSDLHLSAGDPVALRMRSGDLIFDHELPGPKEDGLHELFQLFPERDAQAAFSRYKRLDTAITVRDHRRMRLRLSKHASGWSLACRLLPAKIQRLDEIGASPVFKDILRMESGLVLLSGPTGSGKTTTAAAMIDEMNRTRGLRIATAENPIEFIHKSHRSLITQREVPRDVASYEDAMLDGLRDDLDVLFFGELRDPRELRAAVTAADTGVLVLATTHARTATGAVQRLVDAFPTGEKDLARSMIADSLRLFSAQSLVKRSDGEDRVMACEILVSTPGVRNLIRKGDLAQLESAIQTGGNHGMMTLRQAMDKLLADGQIQRVDADQALRGRSNDL